MIIYNLVLFVLAVIAFPVVLYRVIVKKKYRTSIWQRFGFGFPIIEKGNRPLIWIHAVSVGETKGIANLARIIKNEWDNPILLVSSITETGHAEAKRSLPFADYHVYLPIDFPFIIGPIMRRIRPDYVILTESEFWFNFLRGAKKVRAKTALVNGKISVRSLERFKKYRRFHQALFSMIDYYCVQSDLYASRFKELDIPENKITVTGNLKYDEADDFLPKDLLLEWKRCLGIADDQLVLVLGSTHDPEEKLIFNTMIEVWKKIPNVTVIVAPRHPERFPEVRNILDQLQIPYVAYSQKESRKGYEKVVLIDSMGLLRKCYQIADVALVAGSYTPRVGGHSIIEPCHYGIPVIYGPYMHTQQDMVDLVQKYQAGLQVPPEGLYEALTKLLSNADEREKLGDAGMKMIKNLHGITKKTEKSLREIH